MKTRIYAAPAVKGLTINRNELTKTFMKISNGKNPSGLHGLNKIIQRCKSLKRLYAYTDMAADREPQKLEVRKWL